MANVYVPTQLLEIFKKTKKKIRIEMRDNAAIACSTILQHGGKNAFLKRDGKDWDQEEWALIPYDAFKIRRNAIRPTLELLIKNSIITCDGMASHPKMPKAKRKNFGPNRSNGYRFANTIQESDLVPYPLREIRTATIVVPSPKVAVRNELTPTQQIIADKMLQIDADYQVIKRVLEDSKLSIAESQHQHFLAERITQKQFYAVQSSTGRLFTSLNACPKRLRTAFNVKGEAMVEIDVSCCNPLLLCYVMKDNSQVTFQDRSKFQAWTETGRLYCVIAAALGTERDSVKTAILSYFGGPHEFSDARLQSNLKKEKDLLLHGEIKADFETLCKIADWFDKTLPTIAQFLAEWKKGPSDWWPAEGKRKKKFGGDKKGPYAVVSRTLQKLESQVIIEDCCKNIFAKYPDAVISTIHDAILVPASFVKPTETELRSSFASLGLSPKIKVSCPLA